MAAKDVKFSRDARERILRELYALTSVEFGRCTEATQFSSSTSTQKSLSIVGGTSHESECDPFSG